MGKVSFCLAVQLITVFLYGCASNPPKPTPPTDTSGPPDICLDGEAFVYVGSCGSMKTKEGYRCAICATERGCVTNKFDYCVDAWACDDVRCK